MIMGGYIKIPRELFDGNEFGAEKFSRREAFIDLIQMAAFKPKTVFLPGSNVQIERGQIVASRGYLAARWGWDKGKVRRYLEELCKSGRCTQDNGRITILTITDYDSYNGDGPEIAKPISTTVIKQKAEPKPDDGNSEIISRLYAIYPAKCPVSGRSTGKSSKDKEKISRLLKDHSEQELSDTIKRYIAESTEQQSYIKNFSTFLNNLPDYSGTNREPLPHGKESLDEAIEKAKNPTKEERKAWWDKRMAPFYPKYPDETNAQYRERVRPSYESGLKSWIDDRIERVKQKFL